MPAGWRELVDVNGRIYYQNEITRGTQRERPQEAARQVRIFDSMLLAAIFCAYMQALTTSKDAEVDNQCRLDTIFCTYVHMWGHKLKQSLLARRRAPRR